MAEELSDVELRDGGKEASVDMPNHSKDLTEVNLPLEVKMLKKTPHYKTSQDKTAHVIMSPLIYAIIFFLGGCGGSSGG